MQFVRSQLADVIARRRKVLLGGHHQGRIAPILRSKGSANHRHPITALHVLRHDVDHRASGRQANAGAQVDLRERYRAEATVIESALDRVDQSGLEEPPQQLLGFELAIFLNPLPRARGWRPRGR